MLVEKPAEVTVEKGLKVADSSLHYLDLFEAKR